MRGAASAQERGTQKRSICFRRKALGKHAETQREVSCRSDFDGCPGDFPGRLYERHLCLPDLTSIALYSPVAPGGTLTWSSTL